MDEQLKQSALDFHEFPVPGKIQVSPTKPLATQRDLALAYSPGGADYSRDQRPDAGEKPIFLAVVSVPRVVINGVTFR